MANMVRINFKKFTRQASTLLFFLSEFDDHEHSQGDIEASIAVY
jgi:hypothetical protein